MAKYGVLWIVGLLLFWSNGIATAQVTSGTISGTVKDSGGAVLPGTKVVILNAETGMSREVQSDSTGHYTAPSLSPGSYRVTGTLEGFRAEDRSGIVLTIGSEAVVDLVLTVGSVKETVEVTAQAPLVESTTASLSSLVDDRAIRALPLNGRSWDQLALLQPGVILTDPGSIGNNTFNYGSGERFSVGGQRPETNSFLLDGTDINDAANGTPGGAAGNNLGVDTILEFKIFTDSFKAEYGHSMGSVTTAITRSGTNSLHGTAFEYIRNSVLDARNFFDVGSSPPSFRRNQFGGVLGGPIKKDKTFFFLGYEGLRQGLASTLAATVPTAAARQGILPTVTVPVNPIVVPYLNLYPLPNGRNFGDGTAQYLSAPLTVTNEDNVMVRVDHQLNAKTALFARYNYTNDSVNQPLSLPDQLQTTASRRQYSTLQANSILGPHVLNSFRFAFNRDYNTYGIFTVPAAPPGLSFIPGEPLGTLSVGGLTGSSATRAITSLGPVSGGGQFQWAFNIFELGDDFTYVIGKHSLKIGADIQRIQDNDAQANFVSGNYTFSSFLTLLAGTPSNLQATNPLATAPYFGLRQTLYGAYAQDDYTVNSRLTLNLGLRWEITTDPTSANGHVAMLPSPAATATVISDEFFKISKRNFEPRVGLAWRLNNSGRTVLRIGGGVYHNQILPWMYFNQTSVPPFYGTYSLSNPPFPNGYQFLQPGKSLALVVQAPYQKTPVDYQYNVSIQQQISGNTVLQIAYAGNRANHLTVQEERDGAIPTFINGNLGDPFYPANDPRQNPAWAGMRYFQTAANSDYNSLTVTLRRRFFNGFQGQIYYTFSKAMDENSNTQGSESVRSPQAALDPFDVARDWGLAEFNSTNAVVFTTSYALPFRAGSKALGAVVNGWTLDGIGTFTSGLPFTARLSASVSRDLSTTLVERPNLVPGANQNPTSGTSAGCAGFPAGSPLGGAANYYDPCAFSLPAAGTYGNLGRDTLIGPDLMNVTLALEKTFKLREGVNATFRTEAFNVFNHVNFGLPNSTALASSGAASPSAGVITYTTTSSRQIQFGLRISF